MLDAQQMGIGGHDVLGDHVGHVLELLAGKPELLQLVQRKLLQLLGAGGNFRIGQERLHALENVFGDAALAHAVGERPRMLDGEDALLDGHACILATQLECGQVQMHGDGAVSLGCGVGGALQVFADEGRHIILRIGCALGVFVRHGAHPPSIRCFLKIGILPDGTPIRGKAH